MKNLTGSSLVWKNRTLRPLAVATIATGLNFYVPISVLFLTTRGLTLYNIFVLESVLLASILISEVPAGFAADKINRRWVVFSGFLFNAISEFLIAFGHSFDVFTLAFVCSGLSIAMLTGVQDAYIYESLGEGADDTSIDVWGHLSALELGSGVIGSVIGGLMADKDVSLPALATAGVALAGAAASLFLPDQRPVHDHELSDETSWASLQQGAKLLFRSPVLLYSAVASSSVFVIFNAVFTLNQPLFENTNIPVYFWGFVGGLAQLVAACYNHFSGFLTDRLGRRNSLFLAMGYGAFGFGLMAIPYAYAVTAGFILVVLGMYARGPITKAVANKEIPANRRATVLNVASTVGSLVGIAVNPVIGWGAAFSTRVTVVWMAIIVGFLAISWIPIAKRYLVE